MGLPLGSTARELRVVSASPVRPAHDAPLEVCLVSHTHWDREWYHVAPRFRQRLAALIDAVLEDGTATPFLLDGQAITLRDYLAVRPGQGARLKRALAAGVIEAGPWFVLADNLIPGGEAIVRNLEAGRRVLAQFGAAAPAVAYCPDTFGHPAALPTIAQGFGLPIAVVWRGAGGRSHPPHDAFRWQAADGSAVLVHHLPPDGYEFGSALPTDYRVANERWQRLASLLAQRNQLGVVLLLNGADHHARQPDLPRAIAALRTAAGPHVRIECTTLAVWAQRFGEAATSAPLTSVTGELRDSHGYTWTLGGTLGTRAYQKRRNALLERGLLRDVEPWLALVRLHDREGTARMVRDAGQLSMAQLPDLLHRAWEDLLATHPHDTLCGCSIDAVARHMDVQQELVAAQGRGLREAALQVLLDHDPVRARAHPPAFDWRTLVIRNRTARARGGLAIVHLEHTRADVPVGPGSAALQSTGPTAGPEAPLTIDRWTTQPLSSRTAFARRESPQHYPDNDLVQRQRTLLWIPSVPAFGVRVWTAAALDAVASSPPHAVDVVTTGEEWRITNGRLSLQIGRDGGVALTVNDRTLHDVLHVETQRDEGDTYTPALRGTPERLRCVNARLLADGPLRATVRLTWATGRRTGGHAAADGRLVVHTDLHVDAMSPVVQCDVHGTSRRTNHRTRLVWNTDVHASRTWADAAFGPVERVPLLVEPGAARAEQVVPTMPMHRWLMHANVLYGATMIADGLAEAEARDGLLALTLVRGVGELSRNTLPERPGHAGWPSSTPAAQCLGPFAARTALFLHGPMSDDTLSRVRDACDDVLLPLAGESWRDYAGPAHAILGPQLMGEAFEASALTLSQHDERAVVLRAVNLTDRAADATWQLPDPGPWVATLCRLDETPIDAPFECGAFVTVHAAPRAVLTLLLRRA